MPFSLSVLLWRVYTIDANKRLLRLFRPRKVDIDIGACKIKQGLDGERRGGGRNIDREGVANTLDMLDFSAGLVFAPGEGRKSAACFGVLDFARHLTLMSVISKIRIL